MLKMNKTFINSVYTEHKIYLFTHWHIDESYWTIWIYEWTHQIPLCVVIIAWKKNQSYAGSYADTLVAWTNPRHCHYSPLDDTRERYDCPKPWADSAILPTFSTGVRGIMPSFHCISLTEALFGITVY